MNKTRFPDFFIVGAPKAGTSSMYSYLQKIPGIFMPSVKEPNFFSRIIVPDDSKNPKPIRDVKKYLSLFKNAKKDIIGEASPSYLRDPQAAYLIHDANQNAKIIIILRDPVERAYSHYLMGRRLSNYNLTFKEIITMKISDIQNKIIPGEAVLTGGFYAEQVKRYLDVFGKEQIKILIFEEFIKDAKGTVEEILRFLGLNQKLDNFVAEVHNPFGVARGSVAQFIFRDSRIKGMVEKVLSPGQRRALREKLLIKKQTKPKINPEDKKLLGEFYYDDVQKLQQILGRKLPWENFFD